MAKNPVVSQGMFVNELGGVEYELNGLHCTQADYNAVTLSRIASALEAQVMLMKEEDDDDETEAGAGDDPKPPTASNLFGV